MVGYFLVNEILSYYVNTPGKHYLRCKLVTKPNNNNKNHWYHLDNNMV